MNLFELEQHILIQSLDKIIKFHENHDKENPYTNLITVTGNRPEVTFNRIFSCPESIYNFYNNLTDLQKSFLVPKIILYKKERNQSGELIEKPIQFKNFFDGNEYRSYITQPGGFDINKTKQDGAGLKSISITDRSERPSDVHISCKISIFFENILALMNSDILTMVTTPEPRTKDSSSDFRIKLVVGWEIPEDSSKQVFSPEDIDAIERSNIVYLLELVSHDLNFKDNGSIELTIDYQGATEKVFGYNSNSDIFSFTTTDVGEALTRQFGNKSLSEKIPEYVNALNKRVELEKELYILQKASGNQEPSSAQSPTKIGEDTKEDNKITELENAIAELTKTIDALELFAIKEKYSKILNYVINSNRMFYIETDNRLLKAIIDNDIKDPKIKKQLIGAVVGLIGLNGGPFVADAPIRTYEDKNLEKKVKSATEQEDLEKMERDESSSFIFESDSNDDRSLNLEQRRASTTPRGLSKKRKLNPNSQFLKIIHYVTFGDIINTAMGFIKKDPDVDVILGPCKVGNHVINLSQFPISVQNFSVWFVNNVVRKVKKQYYLWEFIQDIIKDLVTPNLISSSLLGDDNEVSFVVASSTVISDKKLKRGTSNSDDNLISSLSRNISDPTKIYQYLILYIYDFQLSKRDGDRKEDFKDGIYHYSIGRSSGVLKNVSFSKIDFPKYRDMLIVGQKFNNSGEILRMHYDISMKTIGNPLFINGGSFYFDGSYLGILGKNATETIGIGGYYLTTGMDINLTPDKYETSVNGKWVSTRLTSAENSAQVSKPAYVAPSASTKAGDNAQ